MPIAHYNKMRQSPPHPGVGWVQIGGAGTTDGDRVVIDGRIYEFDTAASPGALGAGANVRVDVSGGAGSAASIAALVAAINADASSSVYAVNIGGDVCGLTARTVSSTALNISDSVDAGGTITTSGTVAGGSLEARLSLQVAERVLSAADVATLATALGTAEIVLAVVKDATQPSVYAAYGHTAANAAIAITNGIFTWRSVTAGSDTWWMLCYAEPAGGALFSAGQTLRVVVGRSGY